jgi:hypothetical protein
MTRFGRAATRTTIRVSEAASQGSQLKSPKICYVYIYVHISVHYMVYVYMYRYCIYIYIWELKFYKTCWTLSFLLQGLQMVMQHGSLRSPKSTMPSLASKSACWSWNWRNPQRIVSFFWSQWNIYIYMYIYYYISYKISTWYIITPPYFHAIFSLLSTYSHDFPTPNHGFYRDSFLFFWLKHSNRKHHICMSFPRFSIIFLLVKAPILPKRWFQVASVAPKWSDTADRWFYPAWAPRARRNCCEEPFLWGKDVGKPGGFSLIFWGF